MKGLGVDQVLSMRVALANGSVVEANSTNEHADLLWCGGRGAKLPACPPACLPVGGCRWQVAHRCIATCRLAGCALGRRC